MKFVKSALLALGLLLAAHGTVFAQAGETPAATPAVSPVRAPLVPDS
jgi:hypothetical protein